MSDDESKHLLDLYDGAEELLGSDDEGAMSGHEELLEVKRQLIELEVLGEGALKRVSKCYDARTKRYVAVAKPKGEQYYDQFIYEAWITASLQHPNIIHLYDLNHDEDGVPFFIMDLKVAKDLGTFHAGIETLRQRLDLYLKVCDAMAYAHQQRVIHLDLKPENILCDDFGGVTVCDWGLSKYLSRDGTVVIKGDEHFYEHANDTVYGEMKGTPGYMAPEQINRGGVKDVRTDVFSMGALLYFLIVGEPPFAGETRARLANTLEGIGKEERALLASQNTPSTVVAIIEKALQVDPAERYQTVCALREDIDFFLDGYTAKAEDVGMYERFRRYVRRHRLAFSSVVIILATVVALLVGTRVLQMRYEEQSISKEVKLEQVTEQLAEAQFAASTYADTLYANEEGVNMVIQKTHKELLSEEFGTQNMLQQLKSSELLLKRLRKVTTPHSQIVASHRLCYLYSIQMDIARALQHESEITPLLENFADYDFSMSKRPTEAQLEAFFAHAEKLTMGGYDSVGAIERLLECILCYDKEYRLSGDVDYGRSVASMIRIMNHRLHPLEVQYSDREMRISVTNPNQMRFSRFGRNKDLINLCKLNRLSLNAQTGYNLYMLNEMKVKSVDLSGVQGPISLSGLVKLPHLEELTIRKGAIPRNHLRKLVYSEREYKLVIVE